MANTDSRNFRCPAKKWEAAKVKAADMRAAHYDVDLSKVLNVALDQFLAESNEEVARRLGVKKSDKPVRIYRRPAPRSA